LGAEAHPRARRLLLDHPHADAAMKRTRARDD